MSFFIIWSLGESSRLKIDLGVILHMTFEIMQEVQRIEEWDYKKLDNMNLQWAMEKELLKIRKNGQRNYLVQYFTEAEDGIIRKKTCAAERLLIKGHWWPHKNSWNISEKFEMESGDKLVV